jgi:hypothetical protein
MSAEWIDLSGGSGSDYDIGYNRPNIDILSIMDKNDDDFIAMIDVIKYRPKIIDSILNNNNIIINWSILDSL